MALFLGHVVCWLSRSTWFLWKITVKPETAGHSCLGGPTIPKKHILLAPTLESSMAVRPCESAASFRPCPSTRNSRGTLLIKTNSPDIWSFKTKQVYENANSFNLPFLSFKTREIRIGTRDTVLELSVDPLHSILGRRKMHVFTTRSFKR